MLARTIVGSASPFLKIRPLDFALVPSTAEPRRKCNPPIPARLYRTATMISRRQRHTCGRPCPCLGAHLGRKSALYRSSLEQRGPLPAAIWLFHFLEMGEALPELVGEADWPPASRAMLCEGLRVRRDAGYHLHLSSVACVCFIVTGSCLEKRSASYCSRLKHPQWTAVRGLFQAARLPVGDSLL